MLIVMHKSSFAGDRGPYRPGSGLFGAFMGGEVRLSMS
jgi:hypothetical protein